MTLKEYLAGDGLSLTQIGEALGFSESAVRKWVYGEREPDLKTALEIESLTGGSVTVADLVTDRPRKRGRAA